MLSTGLLLRPAIWVKGDGETPDKRFDGAVGRIRCEHDEGVVRRPDGWWSYPERCPNGHEWRPGRVLVSWERCHCAGAQTLHPDRAIWGHFRVACREPGCTSTWYDPP